MAHDHCLRCCRCLNRRPCCTCWWAFHINPRTRKSGRSLTRTDMVRRERLGQLADWLAEDNPVPSVVRFRTEFLERHWPEREGRALRRSARRWRLIRAAAAATATSSAGPHP